MRTLALSPYIKRGTVHSLGTLTIIQSIQRKRHTLTGRKGYYSKEGPNQYKSFISLRYYRVLRTPKPFEHRLRYPMWRVAGHQTPTAGALGRGFRQLRDQELGGPRQHDFLGGYNFHLGLLDL
jgi:hypothetical protein